MKGSVTDFTEKLTHNLGYRDTSDFNCIVIISLFVFFLTKMKINDFGAMLPGFSGLILKLAILISALHYLRVNNKQLEIPSPENPTA
jgi:hypothetical protein